MDRYWYRMIKTAGVAARHWQEAAGGLDFNSFFSGKVNMENELPIFQTTDCTTNGKEHEIVRFVLS